MIKTLHPWMGLALFSLFAGCSAVGPDYKAPEPEIAQDQWRNAIELELSGDTNSLETWWTGLGDPQLDELIARSGVANLDLLSAASRVVEARALRGLVAADRMPTVNAAGSFDVTQASDNGAVAPPPGGFDASERWTAGFDATWEIDVFGRVRRSIESADASLQASIEDYRDVMVALYAEVASSYVDGRTAQRKLEFALDNAQAQAASVELTRNRFKAGLTSSLDVSQSESNLATTLAAIPGIEIQLEFSRNRLAVLLGERPGELDQELEAVRPIPVPPRELTLGLPTELLRRRPDVRAAERRLAAQTARIGIATAELYPSFSLSGFLGLESTNLGDLLQADSLVWNLGAPVRWNVFDGGRIRSAIEAEQARTQQSWLAYESTVLRALQEVEDSLAAFRFERERRDRLLEAVDATERSVALVQTQYKSGLTNFQNVLDTQRSLFVSQDELAESEGRVVLDLIALNKALGGGWPFEGAAAQAQELLAASADVPAQDIDPAAASGR